MSTELLLFIVKTAIAALVIAGASSIAPEEPGPRRLPHGLADRHAAALTFTQLQGLRTDAADTGEVRPVGAGVDPDLAGSFSCRSCSTGGSRAPSGPIWPSASRFCTPAASSSAYSRRGCWAEASGRPVAPFAARRGEPGGCERVGHRPVGHVDVGHHGLEAGRRETVATPMSENQSSSEAVMGRTRIGSGVVICTEAAGARILRRPASGVETGPRMHRARGRTTGKGSPDGLTPRAGWPPHLGRGRRGAAVLARRQRLARRGLGRGRRGDCRARLAAHPAFLQLRSGLAGEFIQKFVNHRLAFAVIGDVDRIAESEALRDFVRESNRGRSVFFLPDLDAFAAKLAALGG